MCGSLRLRLVVAPSFLEVETVSLGKMCQPSVLDLAGPLSAVRLHQAVPAFDMCFAPIADTSVSMASIQAGPLARGNPWRRAPDHTGLVRIVSTTEARAAGLCS